MTQAAGTPAGAPDLPAVGVPDPATGELAPDGMSVLPLGRVAGASLARFSLPAERIGRAVKHRQVHEIWTVVAGEGKLWRRLAGAERTDDLVPGVAFTIAPETCFQLRAAAAGLSVVAATVPPWPGAAEARLVTGYWPVPAEAPPEPVAIRSAQPADCAMLAALAVRSKAYWGYPEAFLRACARELAVRAEDLPRTRLAAGDGVPLGFYALGAPCDGTMELEALFVDPPYIGAGLGGRLLDDALALAAAAGASRLLIQADPGAAPFYAARGARRIGTRPSGSIAGRSLPLMEIRTAAADRHGRGFDPNGATRE